MTKIAVPIRPKNYEEGENLILTAQILGAEIIEIWCDRLELKDAQRLVVASELPVIVNLKDESENGKFKGDIYDRIKFLETLVNEGATYLDLPYNDELRNTDLERFRDKLIISFHDFDRTPTLPELEEKIEKIQQLNPAIIKVATKVVQDIDMLNLFKVQINHKELWGKCVILGMGPKGKLTRVLSKMFQQPFVFGAIDSKYRTAPGQLTIKQLKNEWKRLSL